MNVINAFETVSNAIKEQLKTNPDWKVSNSRVDQNISKTELKLEYYPNVPQEDNSFRVPMGKKDIIIINIMTIEDVKKKTIQIFVNGNELKFFDPIVGDLAIQFETLHQHKENFINASKQLADGSWRIGSV